MKIGILTLPLHTNYGGILQAYALQTVLERMGHEVYLIDRQKYPIHLPLWKAPLSYSKRILKNIIGKPCTIFYERQYNIEYPIESQNTDIFINKYIRFIKAKHLKDLQSVRLDAIVVGSDQVWRPVYDKHIENAYLKFASNWDIKRVAYAASFGTDEWEYSKSQTLICKNLIRQFDAVSVREQSGIDMCRRYFDVEAEHVLDPTFLLNAEDYIHLFKDSKVPQNRGNLLCYILDNSLEKEALITKIAKEKQLIPFIVNSNVEDKSLKLESRIQPSVEQWLRGFYDAEFVVTDSFHGCVFSIIFNKPFIVFGNYKRGLSRFTSLLGMFGLENRFITQKTDLTNEIEWERVKSVLRKRKSQSESFLKQSLDF